MLVVARTDSHGTMDMGRRPDSCATTVNYYAKQVVEVVFPGFSCALGGFST